MSMSHALKRKAFRLAFTCAIFVLSFTPFACTSSNQTESETTSEDNTRQVGGEVFDVKGGTIELKNVEVLFESNSYTGDEIKELRGSIKNNTDRIYRDFEIKLEAIGAEVESKNIKIMSMDSDGLMPGDSTYFQELVTTFDVRDPGKKNYDLDNLYASFPVEYNFRMVSPENTDSMQYETENLSLLFSLSKSNIKFALKNKSKNTINIIWNRSSYVDAGGSSKKIIHEGVKYSNKGQSIPPTTIPPRARHEDVIVPAEYVYYDENINDWKKRPFFPTGGEAKMYEGKTVSVFISLEVEGESKNMNFEFEIEDVSPVGV